MENVLSELIRIVTEAAPELWRIGLQQVRVLVLTGAVESLLGLVALFIALRLGLKLKGRDLFDEPGLCVGFVGSAVVGFILLSTGFPDVVQGLLNPEYLAIKFIVDLGKVVQ